MKFFTKLIILTLLFTPIPELWAQSSNPVPTSTSGLPDDKPRPLFSPDSGCRRSFTFQRQNFPLDSGRRQDGEGLKKIFSSNPEAYRLLTEYQSGAATKALPAYIGSLGLLTIIAASFAPNQISSNVHQEKLLRYGFVGTGLITLGLAYFLHQRSLQKNEEQLTQAVGVFNQGQLPVKQVQLNLNDN